MMTRVEDLKKIEIAAGQKPKERDFWLDKLSGEFEKSLFPSDFIENKTEQILETLEIQFDEELFTQLLGIAGDSDSKLYLVLAAGLVLLLHRYIDNHDIIVGTPIYRETTGGELINTVLILRNRFTPDMTFKDLLLQVKQTVIEAVENRNYPVEILANQLNKPFSPEEDFPLFDVSILLENIHDKDYLRHIRHGMTFVFLRTGGYISLAVEYNSLRYRRDTIERIVGHLVKVLKGGLTGVDDAISNLEILSPGEKRHLLFDFNDTAAEYPADMTIHGLFEEQVERSPDNIAVVGALPHDHPALSYREINEKSNRLAGLLKEKGVFPDTIVGIMLERSVEMIIGIMGILKSGGAYLSIDSNYPPERIEYMLKDSGAKILLTSRELFEKSIEKRIIVDCEILMSTSGVTFHHSSSIIHRSSHLAYVIYTSGSTGKPKGVLIPHRGIINFAFFHKEVFNTDDYLRATQVSSPGFDAMSFEIWPCLLRGAALYIVRDDIRIVSCKLKEFLVVQKITASFQSTAVAMQLLDEEWPENGVALRILWTAGDRLTRYTQQSYPFRFYNLYGPTEDSVWTTWMEVPVNPGIETFPPIGKPIANHRIYILDGSLKLQPVGVPGELCISSVGTSRGYLNNPELTVEKFIGFHHLPFNIHHSKLYRSGDLARWLPDGNIEFLGRTDSQVKIRGFRVEPGEIESWLLKHEDVKGAVVVAGDDRQGNKYLCAYIVFNTSPVELKDYLGKELPAYMVPTHFVSLTAIPLTPSGKVDRAALPEPGKKIGGSYVPPSDETEWKLAEIWSEILAIEKHCVSIDANFFQLGGHSLKATTLASRVHKEFNVILPLAVLFKTPNIRALARYIAGANAEILSIEDENLILLKETNGTGGNLFFIHDGAGGVEGYIEFCNRLSTEVNCWGLQADKMENYGPQTLDLRNVAEKYIAKITRIQPMGPYFIAGWSTGGIISFEMVRQLEELKKDIGFFAMIDAAAPRPEYVKEANPFTLETELDFVQKYLPGFAVNESIKGSYGLDRFWADVVDYLETNPFAIEIIKQLITQNEVHVIPGDHRQSTGGLIKSLNMGRTFRYAHAVYMPAGNIAAPLHYFAAAYSKANRIIKEEQWLEYCSGPIMLYEIPGDHYTIFRKPSVIDFASLFDKLLTIWYSKGPNV